MINRALNTCLILILGLTTAPVSSQEDAAALKAHTYGKTLYFSTGIGEDEREGLLAATKDYNLKVISALKSGEYLADVKIEITNTEGDKMLKTVAEGPWLFVKLPPGKYLVEADAMGKVLHKQVTVKRTGQSVVVFYWPEER